MTIPDKDKIKCSDRQLAILGLALKELNAETKPIISRLAALKVDYSEIANVTIGKLWKLILEGGLNIYTFKMQVERMWPTQIEAHNDLFFRAINATKNVTPEWGMEAINTDYEIKSFHKVLQTWTLDYNKIVEYNKQAKVPLSDDELHAKWRKSCRDFMAQLNSIYETPDAPKKDLGRFNRLVNRNPE